MNLLIKSELFKFNQMCQLKDKNAPPRANAGGDQVIKEPINLLIINGSQSTDDLKIKQWQWTRDPSSLAIGKIVENTDNSPILMVIWNYPFKC